MAKLSCSSKQSNRFIQSLYCINLHAGNFLLGLVGRGHDGLGEAELGGFLEALLPALWRAAAPEKHEATLDPFRSQAQ